MQNFYFDWVIDATVPVIANHTPTTGASLSGPHTITFSEPVQGVTTSSVIVHAESANVNIPGTIARPSSLDRDVDAEGPRPGRDLSLSFSTAIHDVAGNPLTATFFNVRTLTTLENTAKALQRSWDVDSRTIASGDHYIVSRLAGSRAELTFNATAGQTVSVYGIRLPDGGYADVYPRRGQEGTPSFYAATATRPACT